MKVRPSRAIFCLVLVLMVSAILGGVFGGQVRATAKGEEDADTAIKHFSTILGLVEENYVNEVVSKLKGPRGTSVKIKVVRPGVDEPIEMNPIRDEIAKYTINTAFMIRPKVGYIKLDSFAETTGQELRDSLKKLRDELKKSDAKDFDGIVFDLRNNPGGLLQEAIEVCETFLQKGQLIVETRGRTRGSNRPY